MSRPAGPDGMGESLPFIDLGPGVKAKGITTGTYRTCIVTTDGRVACWGRNVDGVLGIGGSLTPGGCTRADGCRSSFTFTGT